MYLLDYSVWMHATPLEHCNIHEWKNVKRKFQGLPQSQVAANPWHHKEEENDKNQHAQNKQTYQKHTDQLSHKNKTQRKT